MNFVLVLLGMVCGALAGLIGVAGGLFLIPTLVLILGFNEKLAQGTTLAVLVVPVGLGAAFLYYRHGYVDVKSAAYIAIGFFIGGFLGASESTHLSNGILTKLFGLFTLAVAIRMLFFV